MPKTRLALPGFGIITILFSLLICLSLNDVFAEATPQYPTRGLPTMVDFGSKDCIPCQMMEEVLVSVKKKYKGKADILFIDIKKDFHPRILYKIRVMPSQVFYNKNGVEVYRHEGFFTEKAIDAIMRAYLGVSIAETQSGK